MARPAPAVDRPLAPFPDRVAAIRASIAVEREESRPATRNAADLTYRVVDLGLSGELDGYVVREGPLPHTADDAYSWLYDVPDVALPQEHLLVADPHQPYPLPLQPGAGNQSRRWYARGAFLAADGAGLTLFLPTERARWNGKLFLIQHGSGNYTPLPPLVEPAADGSFTPGLGANLFLGAMLDQGYAAAYLRKDASRPPLGVSRATLLDGGSVRTTFVAHAALVLALASFAQDYVGRALGQPPARTYYYGHSGGGISARLVNYAPGANRTRDGRPIVDGLLADDAGNGLYLPVAWHEEADVLFRDAADRASFVPQIDVTRQLYLPHSYGAAKRLNARLLREKVLGDRHRHYEVRGVSHFEAGQAGAVGSLNYLDLGGLMHALIERLDAWVDGGVPPPASREDVAGSAPAIALPEVAWPLGVYHAGPAGERGLPAASRSAFAAFDGASPEPLDTATGAFVDMNGNGVRDTREPLDAAWRRRGLLGPAERFDPDRYAAAVASTARALVREGFLTARMADWYVREVPRRLARSGAA